MPILGHPRTFLKKFAFAIEIDGIAQATFSKCSELGAEVGVTEYHEGASALAIKSPGRPKFKDLTLERGATKDRALFDWFKDVVDTATGLGLPDPQFRRNLSIAALDRDGSYLRRWSIYRAWPKEFVAGDWDATSDDFLIEKVTLTYDYFDLD